MNVNPWISHDRLDDEVMVINLQSGAYFAFDGAAADAWTLLAEGHEPAVVATAIANRYAVERAVAETDIDRFVEELSSEGLMESVGSSQSAAPPALPPVEALPEYRAPTIDKYDDLQDLLLLDPIHEVETAGWPKGRAG